jgi:hypothetical protein
MVNPAEIEVYQLDGARIGRIRDIVARKWNSSETEHSPGVFEVRIGDDLLIDANGEKVHTAIKAIVHVKRMYYFGQLPIKMKGFKDEQSGGLITREITTDFIEPSKIERGEQDGWAEIASPEQLSVRPLMTMRYSDVLPEEEHK